MRFLTANRTTYSATLVLIGLLALGGCERPESSSTESPGASAAPIVVEPTKSPQQEKEAEAYVMAEAAEDEDEAEDAKDEAEPREKAEVLRGIADGSLSMEEALNTEDGVAWVVNLECPNGEGDWDDLPPHRRLSPSCENFGRLLCGDDLNQFWEALPATLQSGFDLVDDWEGVNYECVEDYCTFPSPGEYGAFTRLEFDEMNRIRAALFYTRDGTIMRVMLDEFQETAFAHRDEALQGNCE